MWTYKNMFHSAFAQNLANDFLCRKNEHSVWFNFFSSTGCWTVTIHLARIKANILDTNSALARHQSSKSSEWWQAPTCFHEWRHEQQKCVKNKRMEMNQCIVTWLKSECTMCSTNIWLRKKKILKLKASHSAYGFDIIQKCLVLLCATGGKKSHKKGEKNTYTLFLIKHTCSFKTTIYIHSSLYTIFQVVITLTQTHLVFRC